LKIFIARTATALFGWCFSTKFCTKPAQCEYVTLRKQTSSTRIAKHRSFIKLKFIQNFCSSCKTLADQVARNPRFYCIVVWLGRPVLSFSPALLRHCQSLWICVKCQLHWCWRWNFRIFVINCTNSVTWTINTGIRNSTYS
jgi:hypothetical protein